MKEPKYIKIDKDFFDGMKLEITVNVEPEPPQEKEERKTACSYCWTNPNPPGSAWNTCTCEEMKEKGRKEREAEIVTEIERMRKYYYTWQGERKEYGIHPDDILSAIKKK